jgi:hypothetical protein
LHQLEDLQKSKKPDAEKRVRDAQAAVDQEMAELKRVTATVLAEAARFKLEKLSHFKAVFTRFVQSQIEHCQKVRTTHAAHDVSTVI